MRECMDSRCFPVASQADREAVAASGIGYRHAQLPLLMKAVYGSRQPRLVAILRNPVDRFHHAFWSHPHYRDRYGADAEGFLKYAKESVAEFEACEDVTSPARCALYFEAIGQRQEEVFFHCDQLIRGIYTVFIEYWLSFFGREALLVVKAEEYYREPIPVLKAVGQHIGLDTSENSPEARQLWERMSQEVGSARTHTLRGKPEMLPEAKQVLEIFYAAWNRRLAAALHNRTFLWKD